MLHYLSSTICPARKATNVVTTPGFTLRSAYPPLSNGECHFPNAGVGSLVFSHSPSPSTFDCLTPLHAYTPDPTYSLSTCSCTTAPQLLNSVPAARQLRPYALPASRKLLHLTFPAARQRTIRPRPNQSRQPLPRIINPTPSGYHHVRPYTCRGPHCAPHHPYDPRLNSSPDLCRFCCKPVSDLPRKIPR